MARLYRPHVPLDVRCRVALRQLGYSEEQASVLIDAPARGPFKPWLGFLLFQLAARLECPVEQLHLDHDPPLAARVRHTRLVRGREVVRFKPDANDPAHLLYRPHSPEFAGSHLVKTNVRGDHGQHPDRVLIKKERHRLAKKAGRGKGSAPRLRRDPGKPVGRGRGVKPGPKLRSASRWPARGTRKFQSRAKPEVRP